MDLILKNSLQIQDAGEVLTNLNYEETDNSYTQQERNIQKIAASATGVPLDFGHVTAPKYIRLKASVPVHIILPGGSVIQNVSFFETKGDFVSVSITNSSSAEESVLDFVVMD